MKSVLVLFLTFSYLTFAAILRFQREEYQQVIKPAGQFDLLKLIIEHGSQQLVRYISSQQIKKSTEYSPRNTYPPIFSWERQAGLYDSFVHLNFHGDLPLSALLRNGYKFPDNNAFVTIFVVHSLVDAMELNPYLKVSGEELKAAVEAIGSHRDLNHEKDGPIYNFWNQVLYVENNTFHFKALPKNIDYPLEDLKNGVTMIKKFADFLGLKDISKFLKNVIAFDEGFLTAFRIPADADDTGTNMALGMQLIASNRKETDSAEYMWFLGNHFNFNGTLSKLYSKSYRPFSTNEAASLIDPRTYIWIRGFLEEEANNNGVKGFEFSDEDFALIATWLQSADEVAEQYNYARMPFNVNNVDLSVTANALYGITSVYKLSHIIDIKPFSEIENFYMTNIRLLAWSLKERMVEKYNNLALLYYPPKFAFYWFVSRIINLLGSEIKGKKLSYQHEPDQRFAEVAQEARDVLKDAMVKYGVPEILGTVQCTENYDSCYWDDFLGAAEKWKNKSVPIPEDRVFSTSMALNALLDTFSSRTETVEDTIINLKWMPSDGPDYEKLANVIEGATKWLATKAWFYPKENAFFSASIKDRESVSFSFPSNFAKLLNGTYVDCRNSDGSFGDSTNRLTVAMKGVVSKEEYEKLIDEPMCFNKTFPSHRVGQSLNCEDCNFPYWSSPALTESARLLALSKYLNIKYQK